MLGPRLTVQGVAGDGGQLLNPFGGPQPDHPDTIVVGTGSTRLFRVQVRISHDAGETVLHISPGGLTPPPRLINRLWIARKVRQVLLAAPSLR